MRPLRRFLSRLGSVAIRRQHERRLKEEFEEHIALQTADNQRSGMSPAEAHRRAMLKFGALEAIKEEYRDQRGLPFLETLLQDVRYACRTLARDRGFALAGVLALTLGIGTTTAVFSVVDHAMLRPLPYHQAERLFWTGIVIPGLSDEMLPGAWYSSWRSHQSVFEKLAAFTDPGDCALTNGAGVRQEEPLGLRCASVAASFLPVLRIEPAIGRNFTVEEDRPGGQPVALISWGLWQRRFGGDPSLAGRTITLDGEIRTIVGVLPRDFEFPSLLEMDILKPLLLNEAQENIRRGTRLLRVVGRLEPHIQAEQAQAALQPLFESSREQIPQSEYRKRVRLAFVSFQDRQVRDIRTAFFVLMGAVVCVLLIACANVANLLLARTTARHQEIAVRLALGAGRIRLVRQWLTESAVLGVVGGGCGALFSIALLKLMVAVAPEGIPRLRQATLDGRVLFFSLCLSLASSLLFGMAPAIQLRRHNVIGRSQSADATGWSWVRHSLIVAQLSISLVLLTGAGLLLKSLWLLARVDTGIRPENVLVAHFPPPAELAHQPQPQLAFYEETLRRIARLPAMTVVTLSDGVPPVGRQGKNTLTIEGRPMPPEGDPSRMVSVRFASPGYLPALGIRLVEGRFFNERDNATSARVIVVNESLAKRLFPGEDPVGKRVDGDATRPWKTIVGVAADVKNNGLREPVAPEIIHPYAQMQAEVSPFIVVRTVLAPAAAERLIKAELNAINPALPVEVQSLEHNLDLQLVRPRFQALLLTLFAGVALLLSLLGIYGVMSYLVIQRTREIGIRMALGASDATVRRLVVGRAFVLAAVGVAIGLVGAWIGTRSLASLLFGVQPHDPNTFVLVAMLLMTMCVLGSYVPAYRASRIDPMSALRVS